MEAAMTGWLLKRCAAFGADEWRHRWCVLVYSEKDKAWLLNCYADEAATRKLNSIVMSQGSRLIWIQSEEAPQELARVLDQKKPYSFVIDAGAGRLCPYYIFDAASEAMLSVWAAAVSSRFLPGQDLPVATLDRSQLLWELFNTLDEGSRGAGLGRLTSQELLKYAVLCGFEGSGEEWTEEYQDLCEDHGWDFEMGLSELQFTEFMSVNSDDELRQLAQELRRNFPSPKHLEGLSWDRHSVIAQAIARMSSLSREELVEKVFAELAHDKKAVGSLELKRCATILGFEGSDDAWDQEYRELCDEHEWSPAVGIGLSQLGDFLHEDTLHELRSLLIRLQHGSRAESKDDQKSWDEHSIVSQITEEYKDRRSLINAIFSALNSNLDDEIDSNEFRRYAEVSGFKGGDEEWADEWAELCEDRDWTNNVVTRAQFADFVGSELDASDAELRAMLTELRVPKKKKARQADYWAQMSKVAQNEKLVEAMSTDELLADIYRVLDPEYSGTVGSVGWRRFATITGFTGTDSEWNEEYEELRAEYGWEEKGATEKQFKEFMGDINDDEDMRVLLLGLRQRKREQARKLQLASSKIGWAVKSILSRRHAAATKIQSVTRGSLTRQRLSQDLNGAKLLEAVFKALDVKRVGALHSEAMLRFMRLAGTDVDLDDWQEEYEGMCEEIGTDVTAGLDLSHFRTLVTDILETSEEQLREMLPTLKQENALPSQDNEQERLSTTLKQEEALPAKDSKSDVSKMNRPQLIEALFETLDAEGRGSLGSSDLRRYAELVFFEGDDQSWSEEFAGMCAEFGWNEAEGCPRKDFDQIVGEASETSDEELRNAVDQLRQDVKSRKEADASDRRPSVTTMDREKLIEALFRMLDTNQDGALSADELEVYAKLIGFEGDWEQEFSELSDQFGWGAVEGLTRDQFTAFVGEDDDMSDEELRDLLRRSPARRDSNTSATSGPGKSYADRKDSSIEHAINKMGRSQILASMFSVLDSSKSGVVSSSEMLRYAKLAGFDGDDEDWEQEWKDMCEENGWDADGATREEFETLLADEPDDHLKEILLNLQPNSKEERRPSLHSNASRTSRKSWLHKAPVTQGELAKMSRTQLLEAIFKSLDVNKDETLSESELLRYAQSAGFEGDQEDFKAEFGEMAEEHGWEAAKGVTREQFEELLEEEDEEHLKEMLLNLSSKDSRRPSLHSSTSRKSWLLRKGSVSLAEIAKMDRTQLLEALFKSLDLDKDGMLTAPEMFRYARQSGFEGDEAEWEEEFKGMAQDFGWDARGASREQFFNLLADDSDGELKELLTDIQPDGRRRSSASNASRKSWSRPSSSKKGIAGVADIADMSRSELIAKVFAALDSGGEEVLGSSGLRRFAELSGFDGDEDEWKEQFDDICEEHGWKQGDGIDMGKFEIFIGDSATTSDEELRDILHGLSKPSEKDRSNMDRSELLAELFAVLDKNNKNGLTSAELRKYAESLGFDGSSEEWDEVFEESRSDHNWPDKEPITLANFKQFVGDADNTSDDELRESLEALSKEAS
eukprot:TRINITY_DN36389_c0_g1_i1.p1 TRINITY_DN36389_c0_g1~~TRINITY_DN36389_c0_g1_i1.p1  ORF type:complete len:1551 (+),score=442.46 TRINITY_DN36389_c0_g1_i1:72-4655(+)